jgi:hypothetical protein
MNGFYAVSCIWRDGSIGAALMGLLWAFVEWRRRHVAEKKK